MKNEEIFKALGDIDESLVDEAESYKKRKAPPYRWLAAAACLCLVIGAAWFFLPERGIVTPDVEPPPTAAPTPVAAVTDYKLWIPAVELPEPVEGVEMDMIGLVVYKGRIYTQGRYYYEEESPAVAALVGDYLGCAKGNISCFSTQDDYASEFASNMLGDVYTVEGYGEDFRICISWENEQGVVIGFFECLNGIGISTGADIFEERLHMAERWESVRYQAHENWDNGWPYYVFHELPGVTDEDIDAFIEAVCKGEYVNVHDEDPDFYDSGNYGRSPVQTHLYFTMDDNTVVELRLFENGYVGYQHLGWYFVKAPGEAFDRIFTACVG